MSPFLSKGGKTYKARVHDREGRRYIRSLGTRSKAEARLVEAWLTDRHHRGDFRILDAIITGRVSALDAYRRSNEQLMDTLQEAAFEMGKASARGEEGNVATHTEGVRMARRRLGAVLDTMAADLRIASGGAA